MGRSSDSTDAISGSMKSPNVADVRLFIGQLALASGTFGSQYNPSPVFTYS